MDPTKPIFLTKAERERHAVERRHAAVSDAQRRHSLPLPAPAPASHASGSNDPQPPPTSDRYRNRDDRDRGRCRSHGQDGDLGRKRGRRDHDGDRRREQDRQEAAAAREREKTLDAIKEQYLGTNRTKKRAIAKPSDNSRFCSDWVAANDTSCHDGVISQPLLFGRGFIAGIDRREQKRAVAAVLTSHEQRGHRAHLVEVIKEDDGAHDIPVDRHWSEKAVEEMTERDWRIFREDFSISYKGSRVPQPMRSWSESRLGSELLRAVEKAGYRKPSPIQMAAIPLGLKQRDVIGVAETGSGKTAAFVLPMLSYIAHLPPFNEENRRDGPYALVMVPTRELAQQIVDETEKFAAYLGIRVMSIVGGKKIEEQRVQIEKGCEIVVVTPGRLLDCLESRYVVLNQCNYVVLDEADRMTDMGFEPQVAGVLDAMPSSNLKPQNADKELDEKRIYRTTYMFSATMPPAVERLARKYLRNPVVVMIGTPGQVSGGITQNVITVKESEKMQLLRKILRGLGDKTAIVFCNTKNTAHWRAIDLQNAGFRATALHGDMSQNERDTSLDGFRNRQFNILVATDVAARGIDVPDVAYVINYDMPSSITTYTHRIGRTGRAGKKGVATSFLTLENTNIFFDLKQMLIQSNSPVPPELAKHEASKFKPGSIKDRLPR